MATTAGIINGCVSSSISAPSSSSSFGKLRGSRKKTTTTSTPANGGGGKRFRSCCISASSVASDPYKILRIRPGASESEVKTAFRQLALKYHPDVCKDQDCGIQFQNIIEAYDVEQYHLGVGIGYSPFSSTITKWLSLTNTNDTTRRDR